MKSKTDDRNCCSCWLVVNFVVGYLLSCATINAATALALGPLFIVPFSAIAGFFVNQK